MMKRVFRFLRSDPEPCEVKIYTKIQRIQKRQGSGNIVHIVVDHIARERLRDPNSDDGPVITKEHQIAPKRNYETMFEGASVARIIQNLRWSLGFQHWLADYLASELSSLVSDNGASSGDNFFISLDVKIVEEKSLREAENDDDE